jgi:microcystin degradation protein MlrC
MRHRFEPDLTPLEDAIRIGLAGPGMTLVGDVGDSPTGGTCADQPDVLRALLAARADRHAAPILLTLCDPPAAKAAHASGIGARLSLSLGHAMTPGQKLAVDTEVLALSDGRFTMQDGGATGAVLEFGPSAVLGIDALRIAVRSVPGCEWDTGMYRSLGLDPAAAAIVFVKSPAHFRVAFGPLAARTLIADTPGGSCGNMRRVPWTRVTRPLWPLDET